VAEGAENDPQHAQRNGQREMTTKTGVADAAVPCGDTNA
jgi:hypothetical protein